MLVLAVGFSILIWSGLVTAMDPLEEEVERACEGDNFDCKTGDPTRCIPKVFICDNNVDCLDKSDEDPELCKNYHELTECTEEEFECPTNKRCLPHVYLCDDDTDCPDGADEKNCPVRKCPPDEFECASVDECLPRAFVCDGSGDCSDGSDELHCECSEQHSFHCSNGKGCPPVEKVCDHKVDCADQSDEGARCLDNSCPLDCGSNGQCYKTPNGPHCDCQAGFKDVAGVCQDVDECSDMLTCDHSCHNTPGNYSCSCRSGYELQGPETCRAAGSTSAILFHTFHHEVRAIYLSTEEEILLHSGNVMAIAVAYDPVESKVYWSDHSNKIYRKSLSGEDLELVVSRDIGIVYSLAIDWVARNLYISDNSSNSIIVCSIVHKACTTLNLKTSHPTYMDLDLASKQMFWVEASNKRIMRANLDGSAPKAIVDQNLTWPNALTFDSGSRRLYWMDAKHKTVGCFHVDSNRPQDIEGIEVDHPASAAVWEDKIYWNDWGQGRVYSALKKNGKNKKTILMLKGNGIGIFHPQMMSDGSGSSKLDCDCSHICLPSPVSPPLYYKCACPSELQLSHNSKNCIERDDLSYLLLGAEDKIYSVTLRQFRPPLKKVFNIRTSLQQISDMDYDPIDGTVFIADKDGGKIFRVELERKVAVPVVTGLKRVMGVTVDWSRRNIYWVDAMEGTLEVATTQGRFRRRLKIGTSCSGLGVTISPSKGRVVVACDSPPGKILSCTRSGAPCVELAGSRVRTPLGVSVDQWSNEEIVYWTDSSYNTINSVSLDGTSRRKLTMTTSFAAVLRSSGRLFASSVGDYTSLFFRTNLTDDQSEETILIEASQSTGQHHRNHWSLTEVARHPGRRPVSSYESFCLSSSQHCGQLCLEDGNDGRVCACSSTQELNTDGFSCRAKTCQPGQHLCASDGICVSESVRCNGVKDCADASDEASDLCNVCHATSFKCGSGDCIDYSKKCDGDHDCVDHSDEMNCTKPACSQGYATCENTDCYLEVSACDGTNDCSDGSDEKDCRCNDGQFKCADGNGPCQPTELLCNGRVDCLDRSDEENCSTAADACRGGDFRCLKGTPACIPQDKVCDSKIDCAGGEDELPQLCVEQNTTCRTADADCPPTSCTEQQYQCIQSKTCISLSFLCDGESHCDDASDEDSCPEVRPSDLEADGPKCSPGEFDCGAGECISARWVCDNVQHCSNGADESRLCAEACTYNNGGCAHACHKGARSSRCSCRRGYRLAQDQKACLDIDECFEDDPCEQLCLNTPGGHRCSCVPGYTPVKNTFCHPIGGQQPRVALLTKNLVSWLGGTSHTPAEIAGPHTNLIYASFDSNRDEIVAMEGNGIIGRITKSDQRWTPILGGFEGATAMDVDAVGRNIYVAQTVQGPSDQQFAIMKVCSLNNGICHTVYKETDVKVASIAVAQRQRAIYFCINGINNKISKIYSSPLDGKGKIEIVHKEIKNCSSLALDEPKEIIYWVDPVLQQLKYATFSGHKTAVYKRLKAPIGNLKVSGPTVQWLLPNGTLQYCRKRSSTACGLTYLDIPATSMVVSSGVMDSEGSLCKYANCKNLCVSVASSAICLCDDVTAPQCSISVATRPSLGSSCSPDPCAPGGICVLNDEKSPICNCHEGYEGDTCYISKTKPQSGHKYVAPLVAVLVLVVVGVVGAALYYKYKKPFFLFGRKPKWSRRSKTQVRFSNPAYGAPEAEIDSTLRRPPSAPSYEAEKSEKPQAQSDLVSVPIDTENFLQ